MEKYVHILLRIFHYFLGRFLCGYFTIFSADSCFLVLVAHLHTTLLSLALPHKERLYTGLTDSKKYISDKNTIRDWKSIYIFFWECFTIFLADSCFLASVAHHPLYLFPSYTRKGYIRGWLTRGNVILIRNTIKYSGIYYLHSRRNTQCHESKTTQNRANNWLLEFSAIWTGWVGWGGHTPPDCYDYQSTCGAGKQKYEVNPW